MRPGPPGTYRGAGVKERTGRGDPGRPSREGGGDGSTGSRRPGGREAGRYHHPRRVGGPALGGGSDRGLRGLPSPEGRPHEQPGRLYGVRPERQLDRGTPRPVLRVPARAWRPCRPLLLHNLPTGPGLGSCALRPRGRGDDGGLLHDAAGRRRYNPQARGGRLGGRPGRTGDGRLRGRRGDPVDRDRHEQPLELPHGADPPPVRGCHRPGRGLSALDRVGGCGLWRRVRVQRRGGGGLRGLRTLDRQTGGHTPAGGVGFRHGRIDAAQRRSPARQAPLGPGTAIRQPHLETLFHPSAPSRLFATARGVRATAKNTRSGEARCLCRMYHYRGGRSRLRRREEGAAMATQTLGGLDFEVLRRAIEDRDAETLVGLYADDAEVITVNRNSTPSSPQILRGKEEIGGYLRDVCGREMTHRVENEVLDEGRVAFQEACEYPDGVKVLGAETLEVRDGKIVRHVGVEAWDG